MKKYQLWLECKTYTQHLDNLIRIKMAASERKSGGKINKQQEKVKNLSRYQSQVKLNSSYNGQDLSYVITARELQKHKLRLVRSKQIVRQNEEMVKRINRAKPFITNSQPINYANYKLKRVRQRLNVEHSFSQKHRNFQHFAKLHNQVGDPTHKYQLILNLMHIEIRMPQRSTQIMLEIIGNHSLAKSQFVSPDALKGHIFKFKFEDKIPDFFTLRIHSFKGLEDTVLGDYIIARPQQGQTIEAE